MVVAGPSSIRPSWLFFCRLRWMVAMETVMELIWLAPQPDLGGDEGCDGDRRLERNNGGLPWRWREWWWLDLPHTCQVQCPRLDPTTPQWDSCDSSVDVVTYRQGNGTVEVTRVSRSGSLAKSSVSHMVLTSLWHQGSALYDDNRGHGLHRRESILRNVDDCIKPQGWCIYRVQEIRKGIWDKKNGILTQVNPILISLSLP